MIKFLQRLLRFPAATPAPSAPRPGYWPMPDRNAAQLEKSTPLKHTDGPPAFVRREAVLGRDEAIVGYEFSLVTRLKVRMSRRADKAVRAYDAALLARLNLGDLVSLLGSRSAFVNLSIESIDNEMIANLPTKNTILVFEMSEQISDWEAIHRAAESLRQAGFTIGQRISKVQDAGSPFVANADVLQIDVTEFDGIDLREMLRKLRQPRQGNDRPLQVVAREVRSHDDFQFCYKCGFDMFQGPFISTEGDFKPAQDGVNRMVVFPILAMLRADRSFADIADQLKNEPTLTYKLLRHLNSAGSGLQQNIGSLAQALVVLGRERFYRWMSLLLFDFTDPGYRERVLAERALSRGRTLELLAGHGQIPAAPELLFLTGLFSLLDVALGRPMAELLDQAMLPAIVRDTLLGAPGPYADALRLASLAEADGEANEDELQAAFANCAIDDADYAPIATMAAAWARQILNGAA